jgi:hypothetical protein
MSVGTVLDQDLLDEERWDLRRLEPYLRPTAEGDRSLLTELVDAAPHRIPGARTPRSSCAVSGRPGDPAGTCFALPACVRMALAQE